MSASSMNSSSSTPFPDQAPASHSGEEPAPVTIRQVSPRPPQDISKPATSSADDLSLLLAQSAPDPYLAEGGGPGEPASGGRPGGEASGIEPVSPLDPLSTPASAIDVAFAPSPDADVHPQLKSHRAGSRSPRQPEPDEPETVRISWPMLLISSYASALTLAIAYLLFTGRSLPRIVFGPATEPAAAVPEPRGKSAPRAAIHLDPLPASNITDLTRSTRLGDLEIKPRSIAHRPIDLIRLQGTAEGERQTPATLVLTLEFTNVSSDQSFAPLDPAMVRETSPGPAESFIELGSGRRLTLFRLAMESEWSIPDQSFPTLRPGESVETVLVSEPVEMTDLAGTMTWRIKLRTAPYRTDVLGVRFDSDQVAVESLD